MLRTALIIAAVLATSAPAMAQTTAAPSAPTQSADRSQQVICRNQPVTGSRFNHRRCQTRAQARAAQQEAQRFVGDSTRSGPSVEEIINPVERSWAPQ